ASGAGRLRSGHVRGDACERGDDGGGRGAHGALPACTSTSERDAGRGAREGARSRLMPNTITPITRGLRERKKLKTKEAIQREALRLFQEKGYDETTIEQSTAAAQISPSPCFTYIPTTSDTFIFDR